jgi:hypothetical protein
VGHEFSFWLRFALSDSIGERLEPSLASGENPALPVRVAQSVLRLSLLAVDAAEIQSASLSRLPVIEVEKLQSPPLATNWVRDGSCEASKEIEITPEMIAAGAKTIEALFPDPYYSPGLVEDLAERVLRAASVQGPR